MLLILTSGKKEQEVPPALSHDQFLTGTVASGERMVLGPSGVKQRHLLAELPARPVLLPLGGPEWIKQL